MLGIALAAISAAGLFKLWGPGRGRMGRCGGGHHRRRRFTHYLMRELNATPSQEQVIRQCADEIAEALHKQRTLDALAGAAADAMTEDRFDGAAFGAKLAASGDAVRTAVIGAMEKLHGALDAGQRRQLAAILRRFR